MGPRFTTHVTNQKCVDAELYTDEKIRERSEDILEKKD